MKVNEGDRLDLDIRLVGSNWIQTITDMQSQKSVQFSISLDGQEQSEAVFKIESWYGGMTSQNIVFEDTVITFADANPGNCALTLIGVNNVIDTSGIVLQGTQCMIGKITLSGADGVGPAVPTEAEK